MSEAVRGEGAILYDAAGERVMAGVHPLEDLAPRDVVAAAISRRMAEAPAGVDDHVFLDATHMGERFYERFPSITEACREIGIDPAVDRIPVAPAEHYACGGIPADLDGVTALRGFYAVGEVTCTGVHGANRLASNSLTESVVAGTRVGPRPGVGTSSGRRSRTRRRRTRGPTAPRPGTSTRGPRRHVTPRRRDPRRLVARRGGRCPRGDRPRPARRGRPVATVVGGDEPAHGRRRRRRRRPGAHREPGLSPPHRLSRARPRVADPSRRHPRRSRERSTSPAGPSR